MQALYNSVGSEVGQCTARTKPNDGTKSTPFFNLHVIARIVMSNSKSNPRWCNLPCTCLEVGIINAHTQPTDGTKNVPLSISHAMLRILIAQKACANAGEPCSVAHKDILAWSDKLAARRHHHKQDQRPSLSHATTVLSITSYGIHVEFVSKRTGSSLDRDGSIPSNPCGRDKVVTVGR